jgi:hypothetical protein
LIIDENFDNDKRSSLLCQNKKLGEKKSYKIDPCAFSFLRPGANVKELFAA